MSRADGTTVDHFSHTAFGVTKGGARVLIDPVLIEPAGWQLASCAPLSAVVISHSHADHLHPPTLLGVPVDTPVVCFGDAAEDQLRSLGFVSRHRLDREPWVAPDSEIRVTAIPAAPSLDGAEQCAILVETSDVALFDGVDVLDTPVLRRALEPYCGRIDVAFLPTGASVQWGGTWNQMDSHDAIALAEWLDVRLVGSAGGTLTASGERRLGVLQRYPVTHAGWLATADRSFGPDRILRQHPPVQLRFVSGELSDVLTGGPTHAPATPFQVRIASEAKVFFSGFRPDNPIRPVPHGEPHTQVRAIVDAWSSRAASLAASSTEIEQLLRRCSPYAGRMPATVLFAQCVRNLQSTGRYDVIATLCAAIPRVTFESSDVIVASFELAEATLRGSAESSLNEAVSCLRFDRGIALLQREAEGMRREGDAVSRDVLAAHLGRLQATVDRRRPRLAPNHLWVERAHVLALTGVVPADDIAAHLYFASRAGVVSCPLDKVERQILGCLDGRDFPDVVESLAELMEEPPSDVRAAVIGLLTSLEARSPQVIDWSS